MLQANPLATSAAIPSVVPIPAFRDNYIWLLRHGASAVVVDPGAARPVLDYLARERLSLTAILITHHHADHQGGVAELLAHCAAEVFGPAAESITGLDRPLRGGERIRPAGLEAAFDVLPVPGHTLGHLAYYRPGLLFCGDTLFGAGCGRLFEGSPAQMAASLARLAALPDDTAVYCAHEYTEANLRFALAVEPGNPELQRRARDAAALRAEGRPTVPSTIGLERATNPFLRCGEAAVIAAARERESPEGRNSAADPLAVFTALRAWKDVF
ncbi:MAG: hydroxyacylglutathione hydrolase [Candidatus Accumulibacter sp.]|nr:hydroxyacylglutathione hydrolase [Accumulibacter sp.]MBA4093567.1 hydroxyacylglutathione hydrolase [Accumulibacter sp.]